MIDQKSLHQLARDLIIIESALSVFAFSSQRTNPINVPHQDNSIKCDFPISFEAHTPIYTHSRYINKSRPSEREKIIIIEKISTDKNTIKERQRNNGTELRDNQNYSENETNFGLKSEKGNSQANKYWI